jgi:hypothetical protein
MLDIVHNNHWNTPLKNIENAEREWRIENGEWRINTAVIPEGQALRRSGWAVWNLLKFAEVPWQLCCHREAEASRPFLSTT